MKIDVFPSEISASFSREVSCRGGGSAGRERKVLHQSVPQCQLQSPSRYVSVTHQVLTCRSTVRAERDFWDLSLCCKVVVEDFPLQGPSANRPIGRQLGFPFCVRNIQRRCRLPSIRSPVPALGGETRGRREWRSARKAYCAKQRDRTTNADL